MLGVDISKFAVDYASKRLSPSGNDNFFFAVGSVFELPVSDGAAGVITNVFAPCAEKEFSRALKSDGVLIVAHAGENHLMGLKKVIYDEAHANTERADLPVSMPKLDERRVRFEIEISGNQSIMNLFAMTPYYWRTSQEDAKKLEMTETLKTEVDVIISVYKNEKD